MKLKFFKNKEDASLRAVKDASLILKKAIKKKSAANLVAATGKSQIKFLKNLVKDKSIDWSKISLFHLDEYIGLPENHKASFRNYLKKRLISKVNFAEVNLIKGDSKDIVKEIERLNQLLRRRKIDLTILGIGENGHLAFNDPPADFKTEKPFLKVKLNFLNRKQQLKEGWFSRLQDVPKEAVSMSIKQIMKSENIICLVFGKRKLKIVQKCFNNKVSNLCPASILKKHPKAEVYLDKEA